jgi:ABC-2 type transport system ATP-binding protein
MDLSEILEVRELTKRYGSKNAVQRVSFGVASGEIVGLLGPNGSGKSTTLHCLTGILEPTSGDILIDGFPHSEPSAKDAFGFLPDDLPLPESLRASEVMTLHRRLRPNFDAELAAYLIELLGLAEHMQGRVGQYSHGMKRKLQLALALAHGPRLLILDEPLRGLDPEAAIILDTIMRTFTAQGGAVLVATHDLLAAQHYCERVVILAGGEMVAAGEPAQLIADRGVRSLEQVFVEVTGLQAKMVDKQAQVQELIFFPDEPAESDSESDSSAPDPSLELDPR